MWKITGWVEFENGSSDSMYITHTGTFAECKQKLTEAVENSQAMAPWKAATLKSRDNMPRKKVTNSDWRKTIARQSNKCDDFALKNAVNGTQKGSLCSQIRRVSQFCEINPVGKWSRIDCLS